MPAVWVLERLHQFQRRGLAQTRRLRLLELFRHDPVDAPAVVAAVQVEVFLEQLRQRPRVLDHFAIHVGHVERAVGAVGQLHGAKPSVGRGEEFHLLLVGGAFGLEARAVGPDFFPMNQIAPAVGHERVADEILGKGIAPIDRDARGRREIAGGSPAALDRPRHLAGHAPSRAHDAPRLVRADAINLR